MYTRNICKNKFGVFFWPLHVHSILLHFRKEKKRDKGEREREKGREKENETALASHSVSQSVSQRHRHFPNTRMRVSEPQLTRNYLPLSVRHVMESFN